MSRALTIQIDDQLNAALERRSRADGAPVDQVAIRILIEATGEGPPLGQQIGHLRGRLDLGTESADNWRIDIKDRNWQP